ncbi:MAG: YncE family protein [Calditrichaeota bacterium]|nr:MAG: YncE family protein [Calditrichota bacterium]
MSSRKLFFTLLIILFFSFQAQTQSNDISGTLVVLNKSESTASLIDLANEQTLIKIPTGEGPHEVAVSPDGKLAVVSNYGRRGAPGSTLTVINLPLKKVEQTLKLQYSNYGEKIIYQRPHGIVFLPDGKRILVTTEAQQSLLMVDVSSGKILNVYKTNQNVSHMVVYSHQSHRAFVANIGSGTISVIDIDNGHLIKNIETGQGSEGIDISPDGKEIWVANRAEDTITIINALELKIIQKLTSKSFPIRVKFTPDGKYVLVSNARSGDLAVFDTKTRKEIKRIRMQIRVKEEKENRLFRDVFGKSPVPIGILVHPSGNYAFVANSNADVVVIIDLKSWQIIDQIPTGKEPDGLGYSPLTIK